MKQRILLTGGSGYLGSVLDKELLQNTKHLVGVYDKGYFGQTNLARQCDIRYFNRKILEEGVYDTIIHLAALSNDPTAEYNPKANKEINTDATIELAKSAKELGVKRFIFASSCSVYYTETPQDNLFTEESKINPQAPYSKSKYEAEKGLLELSDDKFCVTILRKGTLYGLSPRMRYDLVINTMTKDAYAKGEITVHAGGRMWRPMLSINDAVKAYITVLEAPKEKVSGQIFNVLNNNYTVLDIAKEVARATGAKINVQEVGIPRSYRVSNEKWNKTFGELRNHISRKEILRIYKDLKSRDYNNPIYYNIKWMEELTKFEKILKEIGNVW